MQQIKKYSFEVLNINLRNSRYLEICTSKSKCNFKNIYLAKGLDLTESLHTEEKKNNCKITCREKEVLQLLSNGDSSKIIADKLHISETTAITHRKNLIQKLRVKNTAHLIKIAVLDQIID